MKKLTISGQVEFVRTATEDKTQEVTLVVSIQSNGAITEYVTVKYQEIVGDWYASIVGCEINVEGRPETRIKYESDGAVSVRQILHAEHGYYIAGRGVGKIPVAIPHQDSEDHTDKEVW